ncbi:MAG: c-type cytochrome [Burkholderiaceae bacterium]
MSRSLDTWLRVVGSTVVLAAAGAALAQGKPAAAEGGRYGLGRAATPQEIAGWDIDVRPDGHGVKKGKGSVADGQDLYDAQCASCHGTFGESNRYMPIAGGVKPEDLKTGRASALARPDGMRTVGTKLNYATTLWDYINRAMPWTNPQSLTPDQVYAITAYVLHLNEIVAADFVLSDQNITKVQMPNRNGMTTDHGMLSVKGKPDVQGSSCMKDCVKEVKVTSELPEFARNQHGNLAEQKRPLGPTRGIDTTRYDPSATAAKAAPVAVAAAPAAADPKALVTKNACTACHGMTNKVVGPGFTEVAAKYQGKADAEAYLVKKIKSGGEGVWGAVPMPPQATLKDDEAQVIARWIAAGAK